MAESRQRPHKLSRSRPLLQGPAEFSTISETGEQAIFELKVEVLWGRAYLGLLLPEGLDNIEPIVTRLPNGSFVAELFGGDVPYLSLVSSRGGPLPAGFWYGWIFDEGHLQCAWDLAERAAALMGIDEVRIDLFITRGKPTGCMINEDSVSSGHPYGPHGEYLAQIWLQPHLRQLYESYETPLRIYEQTAWNKPLPKPRGGGRGHVGKQTYARAAHARSPSHRK